jgi:hypothetical protein
MLGADENVEAARAAAPPPFWCPSHGWVVCPLHEYGPAVRRSSASIFEFGGTSSAAAIDAGTIALRLPSPTPAVVEMEGDALAYVSVPTGFEGVFNNILYTTPHIFPTGFLEETLSRSWTLLIFFP